MTLEPEPTPLEYEPPRLNHSAPSGFAQTLGGFLMCALSIGSTIAGGVAGDSLVSGDYAPLIGGAIGLLASIALLIWARVRSGWRGLILGYLLGVCVLIILPIIALFVICGPSPGHFR